MRYLSTIIFVVTICTPIAAQDKFAELKESADAKIRGMQSRWEELVSKPLTWTASTGFSTIARYNGVGDSIDQIRLRKDDKSVVIVKIGALSPESATLAKECLLLDLLLSKQVIDRLRNDKTDLYRTLAKLKKEKQPAIAVSPNAEQVQPDSLQDPATMLVPQGPPEQVSSKKMIVNGVGKVGAVVEFRSARFIKVSKLIVIKDGFQYPESDCLEVLFADLVDELFHDAFVTRGPIADQLVKLPRNAQVNIVGKVVRGHSKDVAVLITSIEQVNK